MEALDALEEAKQLLNHAKSVLRPNEVRIRTPRSVTISSTRLFII